MNPWQVLGPHFRFDVPPLPKPPEQPVRRYAEVRAGNPWGLTWREVETLAALVETGENKSAALSLGLAKKTVDENVQRLVKKMGVDNRTLAVVAYVRWKLAD